MRVYGGVKAAQDPSSHQLRPRSHNVCRDPPWPRAATAWSSWDTIAVGCPYMVKLLRLSVGRGTLLGVVWHLNSQQKTI